MESNNNLGFMQDCLKEFKYPHISILSAEEIAEIFSTKNRHFLVCWLLRNTDPAYDSFVANPTVEELAELLHCNGFCSKNKAADFIKGKGEIEWQVEILYKMFNHMKCVSKGREMVCPPNITNSDIKKLLDLKPNLFPTFGTIQTLTSAQKENKIEEYKKEIAALKTEIESAASTGAPARVPPAKQQLEAAVLKLEKNYPGFQKKALDMLKQGQFAGKDDVVFTDNFPGILERCAAEAKLFLTYIKNCKTIETLRANPEVEDIAGDASCAQILREIAELCDEIAAIKKD